MEQRVEWEATLAAAEGAVAFPAEPSVVLLAELAAGSEFLAAMAAASGMAVAPPSPEPLKPTKNLFFQLLGAPGRSWELLGVPGSV